jgi:hypothetical protein
MERAQPTGFLQRLELPSHHHFGREFQPQDLGRGQAGSDLVVPDLRRRDDRFPLLMEERRKEQEAFVLGPEATAAFCDAAFAQDEGLISAAQRVDHDGPFLERGLHGWRTDRVTRSRR